MVYSEKFVAVVVCNNHIVREIREHGNDIVRMPFGTDYSLRFKNQHTTNAVVNVEIDGQDVLDGDQIIIEPNSTGDLLGFMKNGAVHNAFRFIKKTQQISQHRGDFIDDGSIRISWQYEKPKYTHHYSPLRGRKKSSIRGWDNECFTRGPSGSSIQPQSRSICDSSSYGSDLSIEAAMPCAAAAMEEDCLYDSEEGLTVPGKDTHQGFYKVAVGPLESQTYSIVLHLLGQDDKGQNYIRPKLTKTRITCPTCGKRSRSNILYCSGCGTNLKAVV